MELNCETAVRHKLYDAVHEVRPNSVNGFIPTVCWINYTHSFYWYILMCYVGGNVNSQNAMPNFVCGVLWVQLRLLGLFLCVPNIHQYTVGSRFTTGLPSRIFGCKSNRRKTSTI